jgi:signal transduction histidine kinase
MSKTNWMFVVMGTLPIYAMLFGSVWYLFLFSVVLDSIVLGFFQKVDSKLFLKVYPRFSGHFPELSLPRLHAFANESGVVALEKFLIDLCRHRAFYNMVLTIIKLLPTYAYLLYFCTGKVGFETSALLLVGVGAMVAVFTFGVSIFDSSTYCSTVLKQAVQTLKFEPDTVSRLPSFGLNFLSSVRAEAAILFSFLILFTVSIGVLVVSPPEHYVWQTFLVLAVSTFLMFARLYFLQRSSVWNGITEVIDDLSEGKLQASSYNLNEMVYPIRSAFRTLGGQYSLVKKEQESLERRAINLEHYQSLGEFSALVVHDLSSPLHAANFWLTEALQKDLENSNLSKALVGVRQSMRLVENLRSRIRNKNGDLCANPFETVTVALEFLKIQWAPEEFNRISFDIDTRLSPLWVEIGNSELLQIFDNLLKNSINSLLKGDFQKPTVEILLESQTDEQITLIVKDNGPGLSPAEFKKLIDFEATTTRQGIGLMLTAKLLKACKGEIRVEAAVQGSRVVLVLPRFRQEVKDGNSVAALTHTDT